MAILLEGLAVGFLIAAPVGVIGFLCISQTLKGGMRLGLATGLGAATADMTYGVLVAFGMQATQVVLLGYKTPMTIIGGLFLCYLGIKKFFSVPPVQNQQSVGENLFKAYVMTFFLTLTNPATILDFLAIFTGLNIDVSGYLNGLGFVAGVFLGSALWWLTLSLAVSLFRKRISSQVLRYVNYVAGGLILGFGVYAIAKLWC